MFVNQQEMTDTFRPWTCDVSPLRRKQTKIILLSKVPHSQPRSVPIYLPRFISWYGLFPTKTHVEIDSQCGVIRRYLGHDCLGAIVMIVSLFVLRWDWIHSHENVLDRMSCYKVRIPFGFCLFTCVQFPLNLLHHVSTYHTAEAEQMPVSCFLYLPACRTMSYTNLFSL